MKPEPASSWQISMTVPPDAMPFFERALDGDDVALLANEIETGTDKGKWKLEAVWQEKPDSARLEAALSLPPPPRIRPFPTIRLRNWLRATG